MPVPAGPGSVIDVDEVKLRLNKTAAVDDDEIQAMIDAAEAAYTRYVGPMSGTVTETVDGGATSIVLGNPTVSAVTEAVYTDGTTISLDDLDLDTRTGILYWGYNTAGRFTYGSRNVRLTYTVGALPADHREAIIDAIAWYFKTTQRASSQPQFSGGPDTPDEPFFSSPSWAAVRDRIRALAVPSVA